MVSRRESLFAFAGIVGPLTAARGGDGGRPRETTRDDEGEVRALIELDRRWAKAVVDCDRAEVAKVIGGDFCVVDATGHGWPRERYLDTVASGAAGIVALELDDYHVLVFGDAAIITGRLTYRTLLGRADLNGAYRFTKIYLRRDGVWRCMAAQEGRITGE